MFFTSNRTTRRRIGGWTVWFFVLLLGAGVIAALGLPQDAGSNGAPLVAETATAAGVTGAHETASDDTARAATAAVAATIRGLTAVITAVSHSWWWPIEVTLELVQDTVYRGWSAIRRLPGPNPARQ